MLFNEMLAYMVNSGKGVSDLIFVTGRKKQIEEFGELKNPSFTGELDNILDAQDVHVIANNILGEKEWLWEDIKKRGSCDCTYILENICRFRVNIFKQNGNLAVVMRRLQSTIPAIEDLKLAPVFKKMIDEKNGVIFITGGTGQGKTTTLAALLNELNTKKAVHVVTLEDPIEYLHPHKKSTFSQRELGQDFPSFSDGLRAALRQAPKVILVGEIRDRDTMEIALTAAETGHLVLSTMHTINAGQTINRILGFFTSDEQEQIRIRLADTVRYVCSQKLIPRLGGGRILVTEVMGNSLRSRETILLGENEARSYNDIIEKGGTAGWHSFDQSLEKFYENGSITEETTITYCSDKNKMRRTVDKIKQGSGVIHDSGLKLEIM